MIKIHADELHKQLQKIAENFKMRMENGVQKFIYQTSEILIDSTPYGDHKTFEHLYYKRINMYSPIILEPIQGLSKGSWIATMDDPMFIQNTGIYDKRDGNKAKRHMQTMKQSYLLGDTFYITNSTPYIEKLERGYSSQAPDGIMALSLPKLKKIYGLNLAKILNGKEKYQFTFKG